MRKTQLPPISRVVDYSSTNPGSLDLLEMNRKLPNKMFQSSAYRDINHLASLADKLKQENKELVRSLTAENDDDNDAIRLEHRIFNFIAKLKQRDKELAAISKCVRPNNLKANKNFVEVEVQKYKNSNFDMITTSLMVSNEQRQFFQASQIQRQNNELREMIRSQEEELNIIRARQNMYSQIQLDNSASFKVTQILNGEQPTLLVNAAPEQADEQDITIDVLKSELEKLICQRRALTEEHLNKKFYIRQMRNEESAAVLIQSVVRGFLVRKHIELQVESAALIQKVFRGFLERQKLGIIQTSAKEVSRLESKGSFLELG